MSRGAGEHADGARLRSLAEMARSLGRYGGLLEVVEAAVTEACSAIAADSGSVSRLDHVAGLVKVMVNVGALGPGEERYPQHEEYSIGAFPNLGMVVGELRPWSCSVDDADADPEEQQLLRRLGKGSSMGAPIVVDGALWGELYLARDKGREAFEEADLAYLEALSAILASGVSRVEHELQLLNLAYKDPLTQLANRRGLDDAMLAMGRHSAEITLACFDVNGLKEVNDVLGHQAGDELLLAIARRLQAATDEVPGAVAARVGGDEFCAAFPTGDRATVESVLDRFLDSVTGIPHPAGVACGTHSGSGPVSRMFAEADRAMYYAKRHRMRSPAWAADLAHQRAERAALATGSVAT